MPSRHRRDDGSGSHSSPAPSLAGLLYILALAVVAGCDDGEDDWARYKETGVYDGGAPSSCPITGRIFFSSPRTGRGDIYVYDGDRSDVRRLTDDPSFESWPVGSPDGKWVAYAKEEGGRTRLWIMSSDGEGQRPLTDGSCFDHPREFSPDGSTVYFVRAYPSSGASRNADWWQVDVDGGRLQKRPAGSAPTMTTGPAFSFPGRFDLDFGPGGRDEVVVHRNGDKLTTSLPMPRPHVSQPRSSPDGKRVIFTATAPGSDDVEIYQISDDSPSIVRLH